MRRVRAVISGRVQGVFYRASVEEQARSREVAGWARNLPDGRVEVELQGEPHAVESVLEFCRDGPPMAHVSDVEVTELEADPGLHGFVVR